MLFFTLLATFSVCRIIYPSYKNGFSLLTTNEGSIRGNCPGLAKARSTFCLGYNRPVIATDELITSGEFFAISRTTNIPWPVLNFSNLTSKSTISSGSIF